MAYTFTFVEALPDPAAYRALMQDYFSIIADKLSGVGGPGLDPAEIADHTVAGMEDYLPPRGRTLLVTDDAGALVGCGSIRRVRPDAAELKRMFVVPAAQRAGLGRELLVRRIREARQMGCRTLYADTVKDNRPMLSLYESFGFRTISRYPENANPEDLAPYLVFLSNTFTE